MGIWEKHRMWYQGMIDVDGMVRGKHSIWYGKFAVW